MAITDRRRAVMGSDRVPFWKMNGSGNDFVVVDNRESIVAQLNKSEWTRLVCRPRISIGADGVVFIESLSGAPESGKPSPHFRWQYFNADGSEGEMCGNGAMCGARFAIDRGIAPNPCVFETPSGVVQATLRANMSTPTVWLDLPDTGLVEPDVQIELEGECMVVHRIDVGVPHVVLFDDDADAWPAGRRFETWGRAIRRHPRFAPAGTNVNVVSLRDDGTLRMRTYERGVEAETLACGTGAVASSVVASMLGLAASPVTVRTSSGCPLWVELERVAGRASGVRLGGNAMLVAAGELLPDALDNSFGG
jgi:diaminopimelate epimerase